MNNSVFTDFIYFKLNAGPLLLMIFEGKHIDQLWREILWEGSLLMY